MNMPKSRDMQAKMPSPKVIFNAFWLVTVKVLNSYENDKKTDKRSTKNGEKYVLFFSVSRQQDAMDVPEAAECAERPQMWQRRRMS